MSQMLEKYLDLSEVDLSIPLDVLMQSVALLGNKGSGKTYAGTKLFELAYDNDVQCVAIDGIGKWFGLRLGKDGKSAGLKNVYIFGGKRADFPITPDSGEFVAKVLVEHRVHAILDVSQMRKSERRRFLTAFAEEFFLLKKQADEITPSVLFVEEAHQVLPQKPFKGEEAMLGAFEDIVREGRNYGIGIILMDQRPATVNKNVLALTEVLIALRTTWEADRKVYVGWIEEKGIEKKFDLAKTLPFFQKGEGFFYAPMFDLFDRIQIKPKRTFDSSATLRIGIKSAAIGKLAPVDVEKLKSAMAEVIDQATAQTKDTGLLRKRIAELEDQLRNQKCEVPKAKPAKVKEVPVLKEKDFKRLEKMVLKMEKFGNQAGEAKQAFEDLATSLSKHWFPPGESVVAPPEDPPPPWRTTHSEPFIEYGQPIGDLKITTHAAQAIPDVVRLPYLNGTGVRTTRFKGTLNGNGTSNVPQRPQRNQDDVKIKLGGRNMLEALVRAGGTLDRKQLGTQVGLPPQKSTFQAYLSQLSGAGFVSKSGDRVLITDAGRRFIGPVQSARSHADLMQMWLPRFKAGARQMLQVLVKAYPREVGRTALGDAIGLPHDKSTFQAYLSQLSGAKIVEKPSRDTVRASPTLFPN